MPPQLFEKPLVHCLYGDISRDYGLVSYPSCRQIHWKIKCGYVNCSNRVIHNLVNQPPERNKETVDMQRLFWWLPVHEHDYIRYTSTICYYIVISLYIYMYISHLYTAYSYLLFSYGWLTIFDQAWWERCIGDMLGEKIIGEKFENTWPVHQEKNHPSRPSSLATCGQSIY